MGSFPLRILRVYMQVTSQGVPVPTLMRCRPRHIRLTVPVDRTVKWGMGGEVGGGYQVEKAGDGQVTMYSAEESYMIWYSAGAFRGRGGDEATKKLAAYVREHGVLT